MTMERFSASLMFIVAALALASCAHLEKAPTAEEFAPFARQATVFEYHYRPFWYSITMTSFAQGEQPFSEDRLVPVASLYGEDTPIQWSIEADVAMADDVKKQLTELKSYLHHYSRILHEREWLNDFEPHFRVGFAPPGAKLDHSHHTRFLRRPEFLFLRSPDSDSPDDLGFALLDTLRTIHHEMVHLATRTGIISIPGRTREARAINEEAFATINELCGQLLLKDRSGHGFNFRKSIDITFKNEGEPKEPQEVLKTLFEEIAGIDQPVIRRGTLGALIGTFVAYEPDPIGSRFGGDKTTQRLRRCRKLSHTPQDYFSDYLDMGLPSAWARMLFPESG